MTPHVLNIPTFLIFYILLHGREEWDKRVKQPV